MKALHVWQDKTDGSVAQRSLVSFTASMANSSSLKRLTVYMPGGAPVLHDLHSAYHCTLHTAKMHPSPYNSATGQPPQDARMYQQTRPARANAPPQPFYDAGASQQPRANPVMGQLPYDAGMGQPLRSGLPNPTSQSFVPNPQPQPFASNQTQQFFAPNQPPSQALMAPLSVTDMRGQILANALIAFPHIVQLSPLPGPAKDNFEISVSMQSAQNNLYYIARLTHRHMVAPALHVLLLSGALELTVQLALSSLLDAICDMLGKIQEKVIERPVGNRKVFDSFNGANEGNVEMQMNDARAGVNRMREMVKWMGLKAEADAAEQREAEILKEEAEAAAAAAAGDVQTQKPDHPGHEPHKEQAQE
jgi:hypothetical protein